MRKELPQFIASAVRLFNASGFSQVTLTDIAAEAGISLATIPAEYATKESIVLAVCQHMQAESANYVLPGPATTLLHFDQMYTRFYELQQQYRFFFADITEITRQCPQAGRLYEQLSFRRMNEGRVLVDHFIETGRLKPETGHTDYDLLVHSIWMVGMFWMPKEKLLNRRKDKVDSYLLQLWSLVLPHLTPAGLEEYQAILASKSMQAISSLVSNRWF